MLRGGKEVLRRSQQHWDCVFTHPAPPPPRLQLKKSQPDLKLGEVGKATGEAWKALSDKVGGWVGGGSAGGGWGFACGAGGLGGRAPNAAPQTLLNHPILAFSGCVLQEKEPYNKKYAAAKVRPGPYTCAHNGRWFMIFPPPPWLPHSDPPRPHCTAFLSCLSPPAGQV